MLSLATLDCVVQKSRYISTKNLQAFLDLRC